jgi:sugar O-acyltransferase (sialic acid O-acetyltransferase NeuD family)
MIKLKKIVIFGTGEIGVMAKYYFTYDSEYEVVAFAADEKYINSDSFEGLPLVKLSELSERYPPSEYDVHVALSFGQLNKTREQKYYEVKNMGYFLASYISTRSVFWPDLIHGDNCFILENQTIQPTVRIGSNVMIWSGNHIGHRGVISDHVYISSHVCIAGFCTIGERTFLGVNSTIKDFTEIGSDCFVGMAASVSKNLLDGSVVLAPKSEIYDPSNKKTERILKLFF